MAETMQHYPRKIKRLLRNWADIAYDRELHRELVKLDQVFEKWRKGQINSVEMSHRLHKHNTGPLHKLYRSYNDGSNDMLVAYAMTIGILDEAELPPQLIEALEGPLAFYQSEQEKGKLRDPRQTS